MLGFKVYATTPLKEKNLDRSQSQATGWGGDSQVADLLSTYKDLGLIPNITEQNGKQKTKQIQPGSGLI